MSSQNPGGSSTAGKVIDFQQQVGSVGASFGVIGASIIAIILGIFGIAGAMAAFVPMSPIDCPDRVSDAQKEVEACQASPTPGKASPVPRSLCQSKKIALAGAKKYCSQKTKHYGFLFFLFLIPLGFSIVWLAKLQKKYVDTNPAYGAVAGTATEISMAANLVRAFKG